MHHHADIGSEYQKCHLQCKYAAINYFNLFNNANLLLAELSHVFCVLLCETNYNFTYNILFCVIILRVYIKT